MAAKKPSKNTKKKKQTKKNRKKQEQNTSLLGPLLKWGFVLGIWGLIIVGGIVAWYAKDIPHITENATFDKRPAIIVKAQDDSVAARYGELQGDSLTTLDMPRHLIQAVLATEDRRFYSHFGLDPIGLVRATMVNIEKGYIAQGGSTITQQLAKNLFLTRERTYKRKIQEALLALWLEHELTKDQILSAYLNRVYLGSGAYGIDAAAEVYYGKTASELTLEESATLAGLLKAPSRYSPRNNPQLAEQRAQIVLNSMVDADYISQEQADGIKNAPPVPAAKPSGANAVRYYTDWIVDGLDDLTGAPEEDLVVKTTLDPKIQTIAENALAKYLREYGETRNVSQGAVIVMRPDGAVLAMVGGRNYALSQFNRATQATRSPGSSFKPFVYLTAYRMGLDPDDRILDAPIEEGDYQPKNYKDEYYGEVTLEEALTFSMNTAAVRLMQEVGKDSVMRTARQLGIITPLNDVSMSLALGSVGIPMLEMTTAYATIANGGLKVFPYAITKITDTNGELYYQRRKNRQHQRMIEQRHINTLTHGLMSVVENGTGRGADPGFPVAGKTGTSQESRDAWFIGFSDNLVAAVWVGNDDNAPMKKVTGGFIPALVWKDIMRQSQSTALSSLRYNLVEKPRDGFQALLDQWLNNHEGGQQQAAEPGDNMTSRLLKFRRERRSRSYNE